jgi:anaerobic magnesium-protoporphyrin IX monomethyl ester cyclase
MRFALVNPPWSFEGSIYFGCREPHLPLEYGYARALLGEKGHFAEIVDAQLFRWDLATTADKVRELAPDIVVVTTAPSYLFWRCAPPELRVPRRTIEALRGIGAPIVVVGPHGSVTPRPTLRKLGADAVIMGECEEALVDLAEAGGLDGSTVESIARADEPSADRPKPRATSMTRLPPLRWSQGFLERHAHHHHRFERPADGPGAEIEASRGCPYHCTFCAKDEFRDDYRKRSLDTILDELDALIAQGTRYVYFIDEIFLPDRALLEGLAQRDVSFGVQLRIDNWSHEMLDLLGKAGCVSIEAGVESLTEQGRSLLAKRCRLTTDELTELLVHVRRVVPFVQANLLDSKTDEPARVESWRAYLKERGVWANEPVPLFSYPGSPGYRLRWGAPDDHAWERAHEDYLAQWTTFSDIQDEHPLSLEELERA